ncbi:Ankyrin repeat [Flexibacter flexilis DSM 6793]|uniref:Ankyrin repeat n=1 Tax=Flexibacter flexilis DSM 6793 TaxID=927664 RepID=A0A1I1DIT4_9BACT|nr:ankyrin repeat domain-containing protein [Flexibacter flexilis]SFB72433.1 Ankyrin repeat [Flexibacter flexilis DSM 6793]
MSKLQDLIFSKDLEGIANLVKSGQATANDENGERTALSLAAACGYTDVMKCLIELGADINKSNSGDLGYTPIIEAAREGKLEAITFLIEAGANVESVDTRNGTALLHACISAHNDILQLLIKAGANVNATDNDGQTPLHYLCRFAVSWGSGMVSETINGVTKKIENQRFKQHTEIFLTLLKNGADVNLVTNYGFTALTLAADTDAYQFIPLLVEKKADANFQNSKGFAPMHAACEKGNLLVVEALIKCGANVNVIDNDGFTPLLGACMSSNVAIAKILLTNGAKKDIPAKISYGKVAAGDIPLNVAEKIGNQEMINLLK